MKRRYLRYLALTAAVLLAVLLLLPRSFQRIAGDGFDPEQVGVVDVQLVPVPGTQGTERTLTLPAASPKGKALLELLAGHKYFPAFSSPAQSWQPELDYIVFLFFSQGRSTYILEFDGNDAMLFHSGVSKQRTIRAAGGAAFQQAVLDLLLEPAPPQTN